MFASPTANTSPAEPAQPAPDFDKFFASPLASNQEAMEARLHSDRPVAPERPLAQEPGQFTRLFGRDEIEAALSAGPRPTSSPQVSATGPAATSLFPALPMEKEAESRTPTAPEVQVEATSGPSEFTRVFQRPSDAPAPVRSPSAAAPAPIEQVKAAKGKTAKILKIVSAVIAAIVAALVAFFLIYKKHH